MSVRICHKCQKELAEDFMTSDDGWFFCSSCWKLETMDSHLLMTGDGKQKMVTVPNNQSMLFCKTKPILKIVI